MDLASKSGQQGKAAQAVSNDVRWSFLRELNVYGGPLKWLFLDHFPSSRGQDLRQALMSSSEAPKVVWDLADDAAEIESVLYSTVGPTVVVLDALHVGDKGRLIPTLKRTLGAVRELEHLVVLVLGAGNLSTGEFGSLYGTGKRLDCDQLPSVKEGINEIVSDDTELLRHARRLTAKYALKDLVLGPKTQLKFQEAIDYIRSKEFCENEWGFRRRHSRGHGVTLMFHGPSGTGKTMGAEVVANALNLPLYQIDLSSVVSKWIGETEKNLKSIFRSARGVPGILLFDEGDAIFGSRTEVKGSQDKYSNLEVNYLLQEIEAFDGIVILSTNHERNLDPAFLRRFTYTITFGFPSDEQRKAIWKANIPEELPLASNVDLPALAVFQLSGGNIKNCIRDAAALAVARKKPAVDQTDLLWAIKRECQKLGQEFSRENVGEEHWRDVGPDWEYLHFQKAPKTKAKKSEGASLPP